MDSIEIYNLGIRELREEVVRLNKILNQYHNTNDVKDEIETKNDLNIRVVVNEVVNDLVSCVENKFNDNMLSIKQTPDRYFIYTEGFKKNNIQNMEHIINLHKCCII